MLVCVEIEALHYYVIKALQLNVGGLNSSVKYDIKILYDTIESKFITEYINLRTRGDGGILLISTFDTEEYTKVKVSNTLIDTQQWRKEREQQNERFAPLFNIRSWGSSYNMSRMRRRVNQGEESGDMQRSEGSEVDMSQSFMPEPRVSTSNVWREYLQHTTTQSSPALALQALTRIGADIQPDAHPG